MEWNTPIKQSKVAANTSNPLRKLVDRLKPPHNPSKQLLSLSIGDPTVFGNLKTDPFVTKTVQESLESNRYNGYCHASGMPSAREAIAETHSTPYGKLTADDVVITSGCSGALEIAVTVLANEGDNILVPAPGFSLYQTLCDSKSIQARYYSLLPQQNWEIDFVHAQSLVDEKTKAILINSPSNPCGSVFSKKHILEIIEFARKNQLPIIADEIYEQMVFEGFEFHSVASLSEDVPILAVGGLAKRYLIPGWRLGWVIIHDRNNLFSEIRAGCHALATLILGANTLVQSAVPKLLKETPNEFYENTLKTLQDQANYVVDRVNQIDGLVGIRPQGAMYTMVGIDKEKFEDGIGDDLEFCSKLVQEELVVVLPGSIFHSPNFFRIVISPPQMILEEALDRIAEFCKRHRRNNKEN